MKKIIFTILVAGLFLSGCGEKEQKPIEKSQPVVKVEEKSIAEKVEDVKVKLEKEPEIKKEEPKITTLTTTDANKSVEPKVVEPKIAEPEKVETIKIEDTKKVEADTANGKAIYNKACKSCHGVTAQNRALGKSQIIKGWSSDKTIKALNGYNNGSYGGAMKGLMKGISKSLSADDSKEVSNYIATL